MTQVRSSLGALFRIYVRTAPSITSRHISTNSAIERGIRKSSVASVSRWQGRRDRENQRSAFGPRDRTYSKQGDPFSREDKTLLDRRRTDRGRRRREGNGSWQDDTISHRNGKGEYNGGSKRDTHSELSSNPFLDDGPSGGRPQLDRGLKRRGEHSKDVRNGAGKDAFGNKSEVTHTSTNWASYGQPGQRYKAQAQETRGRESPKVPFEDKQYGIGRQTQDQIVTLPRHAGGISRRPILNGSKRNDKQTSDGTEYANREPESSSLSRQSARAFTAPLSIPYTTAASEFLYGYSVVLAALRARRRKLYNLYLHTRAARHEGIKVLRERAKTAGVQINDVNDEWLPIMDKLSNGRPHNGCILESSPLPRPPVSTLGLFSVEDGVFKVKLDYQSKEDRVINSDNTEYKYKSKGWRHPLVLYVDGVLDEGNLGAIVRSAYFLGVDAIATPNRMSAPLNHIALKASSGAAEAIPIFAVANPLDFLTNSAQNGWRIYASDAPPALPFLSHSTLASPRDTSCNDEFSTIIFMDHRNNQIHNYAPLAKHPAILMLGNEGSGLRSSLLGRAQYKVGIRAGRETDEIGVDSLNVSTASALLCFEFMKKPKQQRKPGDFLF